jgi:hypothetical protein
MLPEYRGQADAQSADTTQGDPAVPRDHRLSHASRRSRASSDATDRSVRSRATPKPQQGPATGHRVRDESAELARSGAVIE